MDNNMIISNYIPYRDGNLFNTDIKINNFSFIIKFELYYNDSIENKKNII